MADEDLLVKVGVDDSSLLGGFARDVQAARAFAGDLAKAATVNFVPPRVDLTAFRAAGATAGAALADGVAASAGGANGALADLRANLAELTRTAGELQIGTASNGDVEALRQLVVDQRQLAEATAGARAEFAALDSALQTLNEDANGNAASLRTVEAVLSDVAATAQRLKAGGPIGVTIATSTSGISAAQQAEAEAATVQRAAAEEVAARQQATAEVTRSIATLRLYGASVQATNVEAVTAWRTEAAAIRSQAEDLRLPREAMLRLDAVVQQTEARFVRLQQAASRVAVPTVNTGAGGGGLTQLVRDTGQFTTQGNRAATTAISIAFALEAVATSAKGADGKIQTALRSVAALGPAFGTPGLIVSGVAAATAAVVDLAKQSSAAERDVKAYAEALDAVGKAAGDAQSAVINLTGAQSAQRRLALTANLIEAREEAEKLRQSLAGKFEEGPLNGIRDLLRGGSGTAQASFSFGVKFRSEIDTARVAFKEGRISAEQFATAIAEIGNRTPALAPVAAEFAKQLNPLIALEQAAKGYATALGGVAAAAHIAGTPFASGLEQQIADARQLANAERAGGVVAKEATAIAQRAFNAWRDAQHGVISETLTLSQALKSSDANIRGHAEAFIRDGRTLSEFTKQAQGVREALTAAERQLQAFKARAEASSVRLDLAVKLGASPDVQAALVADLRAQYARVSAEVEKQGRPAKANLELLRVQVDLADKLSANLKRAAEEASQRVTLAPTLGLDTTAQRRAIADLRSQYEAITGVIAEQGGPQRANTDLLQQQIRLAEQLGGQYAAILATPTRTVADLIAPPDPRIVGDLQAVRAALDDVTQARARVRLDTLTGGNFTNVAQFTQDLTALDAASNTAAAQQRTLATALTTSGLSAGAQRAILAQLETSYRDAGTSVDELTARVLALSGASVARLTLPRLEIPALPDVPVSVVPRLEQVHVTPAQINTALGGPLTVTVQLRYANGRFIDPAAQAAIQRQIDAAEVAARAAVASRTNFEIQIAAKTDSAGIAQARQDFAGLQKAANAAAKDARAAIAAMAPGPEQEAAWARYKAIVGDTVAPVHEVATSLRAFASGARGVLQLADAFGHVNENVRKALDGITGILSGAADAADALKEIQKTNPGAGIGALFGSASGFASLLGVVGGLASFAQGFLSLADRGPSPEEVARDALLKSNTEEMARLRDEYRGAGRNAPTARELLRLVNPATGPNVPRTAIDFREVERVAKELGLTLALIDSAGNANAAAFALLRVAAAEAAAQLLKLSDSFDAQRKQAELGRRLAGEVSTPAVQTAADLGIFTALAPHFAALFQGVDAATADGRRIIREGLKHIFQDVVAGRLTLEDLGGIANVDDLFTILGTVADDLDLFDSSITAATAALGNVPVAFKSAIDAFRFTATRPITATPTPTPLSPPTTPLTPRTAPLTTAGTTAPVVVNYYAVSVEAGAVTTTEQSGEAILASVDRAVVQRARATGGVNHPAAQGIVAALGRIGRA